MKLSGQHVGQIRDALLDAYSSKDELRMTVRIELDENLENVAGGENLRVVVFNLVSWAEEAGRIDHLVRGAYNQKPGNLAIQRLIFAIDEWGTELKAEPSIRKKPPERAGPASIDVFLSYSRTDEAAKQIVQDTLRGAGLSVWTDEGLEPGTQGWQEAIAEAIGQAKAMIVLLSPDANASVWVNREVAFAQVRDKKVYPILVRGDTSSAVPINLIDVQFLDGRQHVGIEVVRKLVPQLQCKVNAAVGEQSRAQASQAAEVMSTPDHSRGVAVATLAQPTIPESRNGQATQRWLLISLSAALLALPVLYVMDGFPLQLAALVLMTSLLRALVFSLVFIGCNKLGMGIEVSGFAAAFIPGLLIEVIVGIIFFFGVLLHIASLGSLSMAVIGGVLALVIAVPVLLIGSKFVPGLQVKGIKVAVIVATVGSLVGTIVGTAVGYGSMRLLYSLF